MGNWLDEAVPFVEGNEGCSLNAYPDPISKGDPWTIGFGATGPGITQGVVWTWAQALADLHKRLTIIGLQIDSVVHVALTTGQKVALVDFVYNLGFHALQESTLLRLLNQGDYKGAKAQFYLWCHACGEVVPGLYDRRGKEAELFLPDEVTV